MTARAYWELIRRTDIGCYYLWGPIQNALLLEFSRANNIELIQALCLEGPLENGQMPISRRDMLFQVLTMAGLDNKNRSRTVDFLQSLIDFSNRKNRRVSTRALNECKKLVAMVASDLCEPKLLKQLMLDTNEDVRRSTIRSVFYMWREEKSNDRACNELLTIQLLRELGQPGAISPFIFPSKRRLQSCFELTLSLLFEDYTNEELTQELRNVWAGILDRILLSRQETGIAKSDVNNKTLRLIRGTVLQLIVGLVLTVAENLEEEGISTYNVREMGLFFKGCKEKERFAKLVPYLDPEYGKITAIEEDLKVLLLTRDMMCAILVLSVLGAHILKYPQDTAKVIKHLFDVVIEVEPGLPAISMLIVPLSSYMDGLRADEIDPDILSLEEEFIKRFQKKHNSLSYGKKKKVKFLYSGLSSYPQYAYKKYGEVNRVVLDVFIDNAKRGENLDYDRIHNYILNVAVPGHPQYRDMGAILECLEPILPFTKNNPDVEKDLIDALARLQVYAPAKVNEFMDIHNFKEDLKQIVRDKSTQEKIASAVLGRGIFFARDEILLKPTGPLALIFRQWFSVAPRCKSFTRWIVYGLKLVLNGLSNEDLFEVGRC